MHNHITDMVIRSNINVSDKWLLDGLSPIVKIMAQEKAVPEGETVTIDISNTSFITPVFALSMIVYLSGCKKDISFGNVPDYADLIGLKYGGLQPDTMRQTEFLATMEKYATKTYIPIVNFSAIKNSDAKEFVSSLVENLIIRQLGIQSNVANGLKYLIDETLDNITEHSESDRGYIFAQAYPQKGFLDVCIADTGVTLLGSYQKLQGNEITTDSEAIRAANRGHSSKNVGESESRGFGIMTSKRMLVDGLGGQYLMISGGSLFFKQPGFDSFYRMPDGLRWPGTIVAMRIPYYSKEFDYIKYVE